MKKIVIFTGSPRETGVTNQLIDEAVKGAKKAEAEVKLYNLNNKNISGCQGCYYCRTNESCFIKDDYLSTMYDDIKFADSILFGSPIYFFQVTGQSKIWLDRMFPMVSGSNFTPRNPGKKAATIFVQGASDINTNKTIIEMFNRYFKFFGWDVADTLVCTGTSVPDFQISEEMRNRAFSIGEKLAI